MLISVVTTSSTASRTFRRQESAARRLRYRRHQRPQRRRQVGEGGDHRRRHGAGAAALAADIEDAGAEGKHDAERDQRQRRGAVQNSANCPADRNWPEADRDRRRSSSVIRRPARSPRITDRQNRRAHGEKVDRRRRIRRRLPPRELHQIADGRLVGSLRRARASGDGERRRCDRKREDLDSSDEMSSTARPRRRQQDRACTNSEARRCQPRASGASQRPARVRSLSRGRSPASACCRRQPSSRRRRTRAPREFPDLGGGRRARRPRLISPPLLKAGAR